MVLISQTARTPAEGGVVRGSGERARVGGEKVKGRAVAPPPLVLRLPRRRPHDSPAKVHAQPRGEPTAPIAAAAAPAATTTLLRAAVRRTRAPGPSLSAAAAHLSSRTPRRRPAAVVPPAWHGRRWWPPGGPARPERGARSRSSPPRATVRSGGRGRVPPRPGTGQGPRAPARAPGRQSQPPFAGCPSTLPGPRGARRSCETGCAPGGACWARPGRLSPPPPRQPCCLRPRPLLPPLPRFPTAR